MDEVFAGSGRRQDILPRVDLSGQPKAAAVSSIIFLKDFGQDEPGRETLGVLINKLIASFGGGEQVEYLRKLMRRYRSRPNHLPRKTSAAPGAAMKAIKAWPRRSSARTRCVISSISK
jgi:hypothetical protein